MSIPQYRKLAKEGFLKRFEELELGLKHSFDKIECLQEYDESGDESFDAFRSGHLKKSIDLLALDREEDWMKRTLGLVDKGVRFRRLRVVDTPITDYTRWEFESYKNSSDFGEEIRAVWRKDVEHLSLSDFTIFDGKILIEHKYDDLGVSVNDCETEDEGYIKKRLENYEEAWSLAEDFTLFREEAGF